MNKEIVMKKIILHKLEQIKREICWDFCVEIVFFNNEIEKIIIGEGENNKIDKTKKHFIITKHLDSKKSLKSKILKLLKD